MVFGKVSAHKIQFLPQDIPCYPAADVAGCAGTLSLGVKALAQCPNTMG